MKPEEKQRLKRFWLWEGLLLTGAIGGMALAITRVPILLDTLPHEVYPRVAVAPQPLSQEILWELSLPSLPSKERIDAVKTFFLDVGNTITNPNLLKALNSERFISELLMYVGFAEVGTTAFLLFLRLCLRNPYSISWSGHLLLPEETIAELIALKRRRQKQNLPQWKLNLELTTEVLLLLWAIHIQIRLQNFRLPPNKKRNID